MTIRPIMVDTDEAIILAGGFGTRLKHVLGDVPKPLAPVAGRPFLAWLLDALAAQGMRRAILATGYRGDQVAEALGTRWHGMALAYSREPDPRGTGGAIALAATLLQGDACFALNGDTWLALDYAAFDRRVRDAGAHLGVVLARVPDVSRYGAVRVERDRVAGFIEKGQLGPGYINAGVYRLDRALLSTFPGTTTFSFENEILVPAAAGGEVVAFTDTADFIDIGVPEDYRRVQSFFSAAQDRS
jgi:D-glycero-alpha-D-manno-heptose 1-phosphate guanylyltransferase